MSDFLTYRSICKIELAALIADMSDYYCQRHPQASRLRRANVFLNFQIYFSALMHAFGLLELLSGKGILEGAVWSSTEPKSMALGRKPLTGSV